MVAGDYAEAVDRPAVEQIHGIDNQGSVCGVVAVGVVGDRFDVMVPEALLPVGKFVAVAVGTTHLHDSVLCGLAQHAFE